LKKIVIKYNLEEYFGINVQMKVIDLENLILSIKLESPMLSKTPSQFDYKQNIKFFGIRFIVVGLKHNTLDVLIFSISLLLKFITSFL
jgi:hypothetical protein